MSSLALIGFVGLWCLMLLVVTSLFYLAASELIEWQMNRQDLRRVRHEAMLRAARRKLDEEKQ